MRRMQMLNEQLGLVEHFDKLKGRHASVKRGLTFARRASESAS